MFLNIGCFFIKSAFSAKLISAIKSWNCSVKFLFCVASKWSNFKVLAHWFCFSIIASSFFRCLNMSTKFLTISLSVSFFNLVEAKSAIVASSKLSNPLFVIFKSSPFLTKDYFFSFDKVLTFFQSRQAW